MTEAEAIAKRIESFGAGRAFTAADFSDVAGRRNAANALGRLHAKGGIARAIRGVYYAPERSAASSNRSSGLSLIHISEPTRPY